MAAKSGPACPPPTWPSAKWWTSGCTIGTTRTAQTSRAGGSATRSAAYKYGRTPSPAIWSRHTWDGAFHGTAQPVPPSAWSRSATGRPPPLSLDLVQMPPSSIAVPPLPGPVAVLDNVDAMKHGSANRMKLRNGNLTVHVWNYVDAMKHGSANAMKHGQPPPLSLDQLPRTRGLNQVTVPPLAVLPRARRGNEGPGAVCGALSRPL
jgi:hypothetical protein